MPRLPAFLVLTAVLTAALASDKGRAEDVTQFESDPLIGGKKFVTTSFKSTPKWDRVRLFILDKANDDMGPLKAWADWATALRSKPAMQRLYAINKRVNHDFKYEVDQKVWGTSDHWDDPLEMAEKKRADCEDFAIFKMFLGFMAGIDPEDMAILIGKIPSSNEYHAILLAGADKVGYLLDNRSPYVVDSDTYSDFVVMYSVDFDDVWIYPRAFVR